MIAYALVRNLPNRPAADPRPITSRFAWRDSATRHTTIPAMTTVLGALLTLLCGLYIVYQGRKMGR